ncbi:MAG TPA: DUF4920 domain-containing protein [Vicinamibacterales bacterium]|jgi:hypothetical protein|nr:DUF4920 domain-containing protein [Vicinamibacterales bacterium]
MKMLVTAALLALALPVAGSQEKTLGTGVTLTEATPIKALLENPKEFVGKTVRIDGVATAVCQAMGCWMAVAAEGQEDGGTVRLKVEHHGPIVFPVTAKGRKVSAQGVFEVASDTEAKEAAGEHANHDKQASTEYQINATGAVIK